MSTTLYVAWQLLEALTDLHEANKAHGNINYETVLVSMDPTGQHKVQMMLVEEAKSIKSSPYFKTYNGSSYSQAIATMSKEEDIFAIGVSLYYLLEAEFPFANEDKYQEHDIRDWTRQSTINEGLHETQRVIMMCLD